jgi:hypothetical protein
MQVSGGELVTAALKLLAVYGAGQELSAEDMADGLDRMNAFIDSLSLQPLTMSKMLRTPKTLASGTATYTLGSGGDIDIVRPFTIERAGLITNTADATPIEIPIHVFTDQEWARIPQKTLTSGLIRGIWDNRSFDSDERTTLSVWPVPDVGTTQLILYTRVAVTTLEEDTDVDLTPGLREVLEYQGAIRMAPYWDTEPSPDVRRIAKQAMGYFKGSNLRPVVLAMPPGMPGVRRGRRDIREG